MARIKDLKRMCKAYDACIYCPMSEAGCAAPDKFYDNADEIVDKWVSEHPAKTYAMDFFDKFPKAPKDASGYPLLCIRLIYSEFLDKPCLGYKCTDCWNQLIPEDK